MKIKLLQNIGANKAGDIVDAAVAKDRSGSWFYDELGHSNYVSASQFIVEQEPAQPSVTTVAETATTTQQPIAISLRELLGQDVKTLGFK